MMKHPTLLTLTLDAWCAQRGRSSALAARQHKRLLDLVTSARRRSPYPVGPFRKAWVYISCFSLGVFLLFFSSCGSQMGKLTLTEADKGKTVQVHTGDQITIQLAENPSTGYLWAIDKTDNTVLALQHSDYTPTPGGALGSGGTRVFTFIAKNPGTVHLQLKLWRSFEGDSSIIRRYDVTIQVQS
jgi:inhibitor of cysteine peptidase